MRPLGPRLVAHLRFRAAAYCVLIISLVPAAIVYWRVLENVEARHRTRFNSLVAKSEEAVREPLERLTADLLALSGLFESSRNVDAEEWNAFIDRLDLPRRHPGIRSIGYGEKVDSANAPAFVERMRRNGPADYEVFPSTGLPVSFPTVYVKQFPKLIDARVGWDSYAHAERREALNAMMRTQRPAATSRLPLAAGEGGDDAGFIVFAPVQARGAEAVEPRSLRGVVFSSFLPQRMFETWSNREFAGMLSLALYDAPATGASNVLAWSGARAGGAQPQFQQVVPIRLLDRVFILRASSLPAFEQEFEWHLPLAALGCGFGVSLLLFSIAWWQANARSAAEKLNAQLRESQARLSATNAELNKKIGEVKQNEAMLAHERELLNTLLEHAPDRIYFKDRESRFIKCGKAVLEKLGPGAVAVGQCDFDFFTDEHARPAFELEQEIIRTGQPVIGLVERETWRAGEETWVLTSKMPLRDKHGNIIGTFGISKDITELKRTELALEKEKEMLAVTLRSIGDAVITTDVQGRIVLFNRVAEQVTGVAQGEAVGQELAHVFRTKGGEPDTETLRRALESGEQITRDAVLVTRAGEERDISQSIAPILDRDGAKLGAVLVFRDVTEKLKTEAELVKASKLESIGVLAGGIAHDFNNILTVILGNISLARMAHSAGRPMNDSLEEAERASLRARELTQRLLTFAKGGAPIKKPLNLALLVQECAASALHASSCEPQFFLGENLWAVEADESQIGQAFQNVIGYVRASMSNEPRLDIHVFNQEIASDPMLLLKPGRYVRVSIRDYGAAIQPENLAKIFEPYFGSRKIGSGLELATAYSIVRKHEGQIRVESISGHGTVFHIYLPATLVAPPLAARPALTSRPRADLGARRVLVMDDELPIRRLATLLLEKMGCTVVTAPDGVAAIRLYEEARASSEPFDLVIMDLTVPNGMGGKETIRQLKLLDPNVLAIVSSGYSNDPVMANFRDHGFAGVVPKPYSTEDLTNALEELLCPAGVA